ncbi:transmembrane signal peptide protein [Frateuria sp. Soil773]|uniref:RcnB family protein n=1 Tax=Frateuria sp. Soil773 TaxID=1736407 RepID=UPI0006F84671|nr:RcnB family protein [Frateuria sp. Soil773]KRE96524.1 transmembrane signal peptide protein [Frateuria sp. Soil773]
MKILRPLLLALCLLAFSGMAAARDHDRHGRPDHHGWQDRHGHYDRHDRYRHRDYRRDDYRRHDYRVVHHYGPRYYGPRHHWQRGHRYGGPVYVVRDYRHYRLRHPPHGYHWVRADNDYLLVAIATGVILDIATR